MTFAEFHNALRILDSIDRSDFVDAVRGRFAPDARVSRQWLEFCDNPWRWFTEAPRPQAEAVFEIIERRQPRSTEEKRDAD